MKHVQSADGTSIAFDQLGQGPVVILVPGIFEQRAMESETSQLAPQLAEHFTVFHYDRRGRGDSTDTLPYAVEREIEDIAALIAYAGGSAFLFGISSGAALALEAAIKLAGKVHKLGMYEPPYNSDEDARQAWRGFRAQLAEALAADRRGDAVGLFMTLLGVPAEHLGGMHQYPMWRMWEAVAPTMAYDATILGEDASVPVEKAARVTIPTLIMDGSESYPFMHITAMTLASSIPNAKQRTLQGQNHEVNAQALVPMLRAFFT
ncbi:alpha/beta fold hydrolase [Ktedonospora formicarum]|uniref:Alpha/beta hydrolase n=1 Tax=Ktedonospora formicarum TaxID=2778364 RepID=A0A8J3I5L6_9CHLR|nr:alpha/beta hydrolase [Ktedonospora formicarum]GHO45814.1 alpha/beta hydrolase [Ktedonospora formicarum]